MRWRVLLGLVLALGGGYALARGLSYKTSRQVIQMGDFKATVKEEHQLPTWAGGAALAIGLVLIFTGVRTRR